MDNNQQNDNIEFLDVEPKQNPQPNNHLGINDVIKNNIENKPTDQNNNVYQSSTVQKMDDYEDFKGSKVMYIILVIAYYIVGFGICVMLGFIGLYGLICLLLARFKDSGYIFLQVGIITLILFGIFSLIKHRLQEYNRDKPWIAQKILSISLLIDVVNLLTRKRK